MLLLECYANFSEVTGAGGSDNKGLQGFHGEKLGTPDLSYVNSVNWFLGLKKLQE